MLGFSSAAFIPRPRPPVDSGGEARKPRQRKDATSRRFLVQRQGYLRNSRRILEIGSQAVLVLDLNLTVRTRLEMADVMAVKVGSDDQTFTLQVLFILRLNVELEYAYCICMYVCIMYVCKFVCVCVCMYVCMYILYAYASSLGN